MRTCKGILYDNQVERLEHPPERPGAAQDTRSNQGRLMAEVLAELAQRGTFAEIADPVAWQRELRSERPLPDREA